MAYPLLFIFVLVHGSWHQGELNAGIRQRLEAAGHEVHTPTIGGLAHSIDLSDFQTHASAVKPVLDYILQHDLEDIILYGHSFGGTIITQIAIQIPERIQRLVFHAAFILQTGECLLDTVPPPAREAFTHIAKASSDNTVALPYDVWANAFINDGTEELIKSTFSYLTVQPFGQWEEKLDQKNFFDLDVPSTYMLNTEDLALGPGGWKQFITRLKDTRYIEFPGSHEIMFTNPDLMVSKLIEGCQA